MGSTGNVSSILPQSLTNMAYIIAVIVDSANSAKVVGYRIASLSGTTGSIVTKDVPYDSVKQRLLRGAKLENAELNADLEIQITQGSWKAYPKYDSTTGSLRGRDGLTLLYGIADDKDKTIGYGVIDSCGVVGNISIKRIVALSHHYLNTNWEVYSVDTERFARLKQGTLQRVKLQRKRGLHSITSAMESKEAIQEKLRENDEILLENKLREEAILNESKKAVNVDAKIQMSVAESEAFKKYDDLLFRYCIGDNKADNDQLNRLSELRKKNPELARQYETISKAELDALKKELVKAREEYQKCCMDTREAYLQDSGSINVLPALTVSSLVDSAIHPNIAKTAQSRLAMVGSNLAIVSPYYYSMFSAIPKSFSMAIPTMAVTEKEMLINPTFLMSLPVAEACFIYIHEMLHIAFQHSARHGNRHSYLWNIACDIYINELIIRDFELVYGGDAKIYKSQGKGSTTYEGSIRCPEEGCFLSQIGETLDFSRETAEFIYNKLVEENQDLIKQMAEEASKAGQNGNQSGQSGQSGQNGGQSGQSGNQSGNQSGQSGQSGNQSGQSGSQSGQNGNQNGNQSGQNGNQSGNQLGNMSGSQSGQNGSQSGQGGSQSGSQSGSGNQSGNMSGGQSGQNGSQSGQSGQGGDGFGSNSMSNQNGNGQDGVGGSGQSGDASGNGSQSGQDGSQSNQGTNGQSGNNGTDGNGNNPNSADADGNQSGNNGMDEQSDNNYNSDSWDSVGTDITGHSSLQDDIANSNIEDYRAKSVSREIIYKGKKMAVTSPLDIMSNEKTAKADNPKEEAWESTRDAITRIITKRKMDEQKQGKTFSMSSGEELVERSMDFAMASKRDWKVLLRKLANQKPSKTYTLTSPDRKMMQKGITMASRKPIGRKTQISGIKIAIDTSGSVTAEELNRHFTLIAQILEEYKVDAELIYWDTQITNAGSFKDLAGMLKIKPLGFGGTDVSCVFDYLTKKIHFKKKYEETPVKDISAVLIFTDGCFANNIGEYARFFGKKTIWVIDESAPPFEAPFGVLATEKLS